MDLSASSTYIVQETSFDTHLPVLNLFVVDTDRVGIEPNRILVTDEDAEFLLDL